MKRMVKTGVDAWRESNRGNVGSIFHEESQEVHQSKRKDTLKGDHKGMQRTPVTDLWKEWRNDYQHQARYKMDTRYKLSASNLTSVWNQFDQEVDKIVEVMEKVMLTRNYKL